MTEIETQQRLQQEAIAAREAELLESQARWRGEAAQQAQEAERLLEEREKASKKAAEDRELRLLQEESDQMRASKALQEEMERLDQQRRAVLLLQQSLEERAAPKVSASSEGPCVEMSLDDSACVAVELAGEEAVDLSGGAGAGIDGQDAIVFKPPRRSLVSKQRTDARREGDEESPARATADGDCPADVASPALEGKSGELGSEDEEDHGEGSDTDEEVWDLDWSMVSTKLRCATGASLSEETPDDDRDVGLSGIAEARRELVDAQPAVAPEGVSHGQDESESQMEVTMS